MKSSAALCHWLATMPVGRAGALNVRAHNGEVVSWAPRHLKVGRGNGNRGVLTQPQRPQRGLPGTRAGPAEDLGRATGAGSPHRRPILGGWNALEPHSNRLPIDNIAAVNVNTFPWRVKWFAAGESNGSSRESSSLGGAPKALAGRSLATPLIVCAAPESVFIYLCLRHTLVRMALHYCRRCFMTLLLNPPRSTHITTSLEVVKMLFLRDRFFASGVIEMHATRIRN